MFLSRRPFVVITFSTGLVDVEVPSNICMSLSYRPFVVITFSKPTRPFENVVITTKGLQDGNIY